MVGLLRVIYCHPIVVVVFDELEHLKFQPKNHMTVEYMKIGSGGSE